MAKADTLEIRYRFERFQPPPRADYAAFAATAQYLIQNMPWAIPGLPFGTTSRISGGILEALPSAPQPSPSQNEAVRLKAIELPAGTPLLEHYYDKNGRLSETVYPDGICIRYHWNDEARLAAVQLGSKNTITFHYSPDGILEKSAYPGGAEFRYEYDKSGTLLRLTYPDRHVVTYAYDSSGRLSRACFQDVEYAYEWHKNDSLKRAIFARGKINCELSGKDERTSICPRLCGSDVAKEVQLISPAGFWSYMQDERLCEMILPDVERLLLRQKGKAEIIVWSPSGQTVQKYDNNGALAAIVHSNGVRSAYHRIPNTRDVCMVTAEGVMLYKYDARGRLRKIVADNGQYEIFDYDASGCVSRISSAIGVTRFRHDKAGRLAKVEVANSFAVALEYGAAPYPVTLLLRNAAGDAFSGVIATGRMLWQWTASKPALRLEDKTMLEV